MFGAWKKQSETTSFNSIEYYDNLNGRVNKNKDETIERHSASPRLLPELSKKMTSPSPNFRSISMMNSDLNLDFDS